MSEEHIQQQAKILYKQGYQHHMRGELSDAIEFYKRSIATHPTAEALTYLGWAYSMINEYGQAIALCEQAIELDPDYGNPYNSIGTYLIEIGKWEEAIPWLEKALAASRYDTPQYPCTSLGQVYEHLGKYQEAMRCYDTAIEMDPLFLEARQARQGLLAKLN